MPAHPISAYSPTARASSSSSAPRTCVWYVCVGDADVVRSYNASFMSWGAQFVWCGKRYTVGRPRKCYASTTPPPPVWQMIEYWLREWRKIRGELGCWLTFCVWGIFLHDFFATQVLHANYTCTLIYTSSASVYTLQRWWCINFIHQNVGKIQVCEANISIVLLAQKKTLFGSGRF